MSADVLLGLLNSIGEAISIQVVFAETKQTCSQGPRASECIVLFPGKDET